MSKDFLPYGVLLSVAYDGSGFHGWQTQGELRTVQLTVEHALDAIGIRHSKVRAASRTDAGVHAEAQRCAFDAERELDPASWLAALNTHLPEDISVRAARTCGRRFHPSFAGLNKLYRYVFQTGATRDPLLAKRAWWIGPKDARDDGARPRATVRDFLDLDAMRAACETLLGTHDFVAFRASGDERTETTRTIFEAKMIENWRGRADLLAFEIRGDAFMKNMVRIIVGTLVEIGNHHMRAEDMRQLLSSKATRAQAGMTAPARGLSLIEVVLDENEIVRDN